MRITCLHGIDDDETVFFFQDAFTNTALFHKRLTDILHRFYTRGGNRHREIASSPYSSAELLCQSGTVFRVVTFVTVVSVYSSMNQIT